MTHDKALEMAGIRLVFDLASIVYLDEAEGINLMDGGITKEEAAKPQTFLTLLHAGMRHSNTELTKEQALQAINGIPANAVIAEIVKAVKAAIGGEEDETAKAQDSEDASPGEQSPRDQ